jgi:hypothetical protein
MDTAGADAADVILGPLPLSYRLATRCKLREASKRADAGPSPGYAPHQERGRTVLRFLHVVDSPQTGANTTYPTTGAGDGWDEHAAGRWRP